MSIASAPAPAPMTASTRVMVCDDSVVVRGLMARWLEEAGFDIVATVANGRAAIDALDRADPDIVLLDIDMPELDGISTLPRLLEKKPHLAVIVISTLTQRNADISLKCLSLGALDYLPKPESNRQVTTSTNFRQELVAKVQALGRPRARRPGGPAIQRPAALAPAERPPAPAYPRAVRPRPAVAPRCLLIGASTGGPKAVGEMLSPLAGLLHRIPTLIVQHMPPIFTAVFAEHLSAQVGIPAREPQDGEVPAAGCIYVAPGGRHMGLRRDRAPQPVLRLDDGPAVNFCRPAVDVLFRDAAHVYGGAAVAVVLTGMGSDGANGARALVEAGAAVIAQDEATSTVWGMPGAVARAGLAHEILPLGAIAPAIKSLFGSVA